jgi:hypothetical protein
LSTAGWFRITWMGSDARNHAVVKRLASPLEVGDRLDVEGEVLVVRAVTDSETEGASRGERVIDVLAERTE